jgi:hypothetical protein
MASFSILPQPVSKVRMSPMSGWEVINLFKGVVLVGYYLMN